MRARAVLTFLLGGFVLASLVALGVQSRSGAQAGSAAPAPATAKADTPHRVVVSYFHGDVRCPTCRKLETLSKEAVEAGFSAEIAAGTVVFRVVNVDRAENKHFVKDYNLVTKSLVVAQERDGRPGRWLNLEKIWDLVGDHDAYLKYVRGSVRDLLDAA